MKKNLLAVFVVCSFLLPSIMMGQVVFGVRLATSSGFGNMGPTNMQGAHFGFDLSDKLTLLGGFDFTKFTIENGTKMAVSSYTPFGGIKYYIKERDDGLVTPYFRGDFFKTISSWPNMGNSVLQLVSGLLGPSQVSMTKSETEEFLKEIMSPWGFTIAFGAEYLFTDAFGLGGEFGLRSGFSKAEVNVSEIGGVSTTDASFHDTYVALTVNFAL